MAQTIKYLTRDQVFRIDLNGLMPLTYHYVYFEGQLVPSSNLKPIGGNIGDAIKTDENGMVSFDYYNNAGTVLDTTPYEQAQKLAGAFASTKQIVVANRSSATLAADFRDTYLSYAVTTINVSIIY